MKIFIGVVFFILGWTAIYIFLTRCVINKTDGKSDYSLWIKDNLERLFYNISLKQVRIVLIATITIFGLTGFFLPAKINTFQKISSLHKALELNKKEEYKQTLKEINPLKEEPSPLLHNEMGIAHTGLNSFDLAEKEFKQAIQLLPHYSKAHYNLAYVYQKLEKNEEAAFELSLAKESEKYVITEAQLYRMSGGIMDNLWLSLFLAALMVLLAYHLPKLAIKILNDRRINKFDNQMADGLVMIANGLRAGLSLPMAFDIVSKEANPPVNQEFDIILKELRFGSELDDALRHLEERMPTIDTKIFVNAVIILRETGGNLSELFDTLSQTINERKRVDGKIKTMTAEGRAQALILSVLPIVLAIVMNKISPEVFQYMYTTPIGWLMIMIMVIMEGIGLFWMFKIIKVKI